VSRVNYVSAVLGDRITIARVGDEEATLPEGISSPSPTTPVVFASFQGESELAALLGKLRDHGVALGGAMEGWPPAAVFDRFRDLGLVAGPYPELTFS